MPAEIDLYGVYVPVLLMMALVALGLLLAARKLLAWTGAYALVWHRGLFDVALYVLLLGGVSALSRAIFL